MRQTHDVGDRIELDDGARGVVRWIGQVLGRDGAWLGVEWDDRARGKHDGALDGVRYFSCENASHVSSNAASFVRGHKIRPSLTFVEAFRAKYARASRAAENEGDDMYIHTVRGNRLRVELCEKVNDVDERMDDVDGRLRAMTRAYVDDARVASAGPPGEANASVGDLEVLGLAGSLFATWSDAQALAEEFPRLKALDLSGMRPRTWASGDAARRGAFARLEVLVLNDTNATWKNVCALRACFPELRELYLNSNGMETFEAEASEAEAPFPKLQTLSVDGNAIKDWHQIEALGRALPKLQKLHVSQNSLVEIRRSGDAFPELKSLLVGENALDSWRSVDALDSFPKLEEVRLSGNPLADGALARHEIIARVSRLTVLNGSTVGVAERKDSEIRYLRRALQSLKECAADEDARRQVAETNPRIDDLVRAHGDLVTHTSRAPGETTLASASVELLLHLESTSQTIAKKLPRSTSVGKLKLLCAKLFKLQVADVRLAHHTDVDEVYETVDLAPDDEPLSRFCLAHRAEILIRPSSPLAAL